MSLKYSKKLLKLVYDDPKGTIEKFPVVYTGGLPNYPSKFYNIVMYITEDSVIFRYMYDPDKLTYAPKRSFLFSVKYEQISNIKLNDVPLQFINNDNIKSLISFFNLSLTFFENSQTYTVSFLVTQFSSKKKILP